MNKNLFLTIIEAGKSKISESASDKGSLVASYHDRKWKGKGDRRKRKTKISLL
jgi:hypothetical protein